LTLASQPKWFFCKNTVQSAGDRQTGTEEFIDGWLLTVIEVLNFFGPRDLWAQTNSGRAEVGAGGLSSEDM
jgi:hypothetical protein